MRMRLMLKQFAFLKETSLWMIPFLIAAAPGRMNADPVTVTEAVTPEGSAFLYDYAVTKLSSTDPYHNLLLVTLTLPGGAATIPGGIVTAPAGNEAVWGPTSGNLDFASDALAGFPLNTVVDGFSFISPLKLGELAYTATYFDSAQNPHTFSGVTVAAAVAVPEPRTSALLTASLLFFIAGGFGRRCCPKV